MGASRNHQPRWSVVHPDFAVLTVRLLRFLPPDAIASYLIVVATELQAAGKLTPARLARISALVERAIKLDKAA